MSRFEKVSKNRNNDLFFRKKTKMSSEGTRTPPVKILRPSIVRNRKDESMRIQMLNFRSRLQLEQEMFSKASVQWWFLVYVILYVTAIYLNYSNPVPARVSDPILSRIFDDDGNFLSYQWPGAVELFENTANDMTRFIPYLATTKGQKFVDPALAILPVVTFRRGTTPTDCPNFSVKLQPLMAQFAACTSKGLPNCTVVQPEFNILNCRSVGAEAPALDSSVISSKSVYAQESFFHALPSLRGDDVYRLDAIVTGSPGTLVDSMKAIASNRTLMTELTSAGMRLLFVYFDPSNGGRDVFHIINVEFADQASGMLAISYHLDSIPNTQSVDWILLMAVIFAIVDFTLQLSHVASYSSRMKLREERVIEMALIKQEKNYFDSVEDKEDYEILEHQVNRYRSESFPYLNLFSDGVLIAIGVYRLWLFQPNWMGDAVTNLASLQVNGSPQVFMAAYDSLFNVIDTYWFVRKVEGFLLMFVVLRIIFIPSGHPQFASTTDTLASASDALFHFLIVFGLCMSVFGFLGYLAIGDLTISATTIYKVICLQFQMLGSEWPDYHTFEPMRIARPFGFYLWNILCCVVLFFILYNFLVSIIVAAFQDQQVIIEKKLVCERASGDFWKLLKCKLRGFWFGWPDRLRVIAAITMLIVNEKGEREDEKIPASDEDFFDTWDQRPPPVLEEIDADGILHNLTEATPEDTSAQTISADQLSTLLGQDCTDMVGYYLYLFGHSFLSPKYEEPAPHPVLSLQKYTDNFLSAVRERYWVALKKLKILRKEIKRSIEAVENMQSSNSQSEDQLWRINLCKANLKSDAGNSNLAGRLTRTILDTEIILHR